METVTISEFNLQPDYYFHNIEISNEATLITKDGKPVFKILPINAEIDNSLKNSIVFEGDLISPIDTIWDANL